MAQGHGMSVLSRAYLLTNDTKYFAAAENALRLFETPASEQGRPLHLLHVFTQLSAGVRNALFDKFVWYEEYPTVPGSYVLNGFMYALVGLHDHIEAARTAHRKTKAEQLWIAVCCRTVCHTHMLHMQGIQSLHRVLPLYDGGSRSYYDLRHVSLPDLTPNIARWDYHTLHIFQLYWLADIIDADDDRVSVVDAASVTAALRARARHWADYAHGKTAKHN